jgi:hypothetical protein
MSIQANFPAIKPTLLLDFANVGQLDPRITFTRASTGTFTDSVGVLQTAAIDAPRFDYDPTTFSPKGFLIEESRTNLITSSAVLLAGVNVTITADTFVAPDGTTTGDQILDNATLGEHYSDSSFTPTAATNYTFSAFIKNIGALSSGFACLRLAGDFNAFVIIDLSTFAVAVNGGANFVSSSVQAINNGWYKISVTGLSVGTTASVARIQVTDASNLNPYSGTGEGFAVWGRQLEAGAFPTSYIPTTTTALTRAADVATMTGANFSNWYNQTEGTLFAAASVFNTTSNRGVFSASDGTANNELFHYVTGSASNLVTTGGVFQANSFLLSVILGGVTFKDAFSYKVNDIQAAINGLLASADTSAIIPVATQLRLGARGEGSFPLNGHISRISYYPRRLTNSELQALTA